MASSPQSSDHIIATDVVRGQKIGWALGWILYEINTLLWDYVQTHGRHHVAQQQKGVFLDTWGGDFSRFVASVALLGVVQVIRLHRCTMQRGWKEGYETVSDTEDSIKIEKLTHHASQAQQNV